MNLHEKFSKTEYVGTDWQRLIIRGALMLVIGVGLVLATVVKHDVVIMQVRDFSWLPVCGFIVLAVGLLECFDAFIVKELGDFFLNLQNGVFYVSGTEEQLAGQTQNYLKVDLPQGLTILAYGRDPLF